MTMTPAKAGPGASRGTRKFAAECGALAWRAILKMWRTPEQFADVLLQPILFTVMFGYLLGGAVAGSVKDYLPTLVPGVLVMSALTASMATGMQLREDMDSGRSEERRVGGEGEAGWSRGDEQDYAGESRRRLHG